MQLRFVGIMKVILRMHRKKQFEHMKTQNKESHNHMENKDVEFARLQKRSEVLSDPTILVKASKSL